MVRNSLKSITCVNGNKPLFPPPKKSQTLLCRNNASPVSVCAGLQAHMEPWLFGYTKFDTLFLLGLHFKMILSRKEKKIPIYKSIKRQVGNLPLMPEAEAGFDKTK